MICATADRWGAGRGAGPCVLLGGIVLAGEMPVLGGWWLVVGGDRYGCAYAGNARYNASLDQRLKVLLITA